MLPGTPISEPSGTADLGFNTGFISDLISCSVVLVTSATA